MKKIIPIIIIIYFFAFTTFSFAEFQSYPDSYNLSQLVTNTNSLITKADILQSTLSSLNTTVVSQGTSLNLIESELSVLKTGVQSCLTVLENIEGDTSDIYAQLIILNGRISSIESLADSILDKISESSVATQNTISQSSVATQNTISQSASATQNVIKDSTVEDSSMSVSTEDFSVDEQADIDNFFVGFLESMKSTFSGSDTSVQTIQIPLPFVSESIELRSDIISSVISGTYLATLVELFWYFIFGTYYIMFVKRMLNWLSTGQIASQGVTGFIHYLDKENEVIKTYMM